MEEQNESSLDWADFKKQLQDVWDDLKQADLEGVQESTEDLIDRVQTVTGEARDEVKRKIEELADRFDVNLGS